MKLGETQALFFQLVTRPGPVRQAEVNECFTVGAQLTPWQRVQIYADMFIWRQVEALRQDFPHLLKLLGDEAFFSLCVEYLRRYPSDHPDLGKLGRRLAAHLRTTDRSALGELVELEWARNEVFVEADSSVLDAGAIARLEPGAFARARLRIIPAFRLLRFEHDVAPVWKALDAGSDAEIALPRCSPNSVAVWRRDFEVFHTVLEPDEARAVEGVLAQATLAEVCDAFAQQPEPAQSAFKAVASWVAEGWVADLELKTS